jgi:DNA polymerase-3 subunit epsilon
VVTGDRTPWRLARFVAVDLETTGLDPRSDEVLSFAAVPVEGGRILAGATVTGLVRPRSAPPASSIEIHGLRAADLAAAPRGREAFAPLAAALEGRILVAHAAWVERDFLRPRLRSLGFTLTRRIIDTAVLWRALRIARGDGDPGWCSLSAVAAGLQLPSHRPHVAEGDALTTAQAFLALATHLESGGRGTVRALTRAEWGVRAYRLWHPPLRSG